MSFKLKSYTEKIDLADELEDEWREDAGELAGDAADLVLGEVQRNLLLRLGTAKTAAPEGQPPEYDKGDLYRSYERIPPRVKGRIASSGVQSDDPGAARAEYGATDSRGIRTFPHPAVRLAFAASEEKVTALIESRPL
jgi:hypothetical protein